MSTSALRLRWKTARHARSFAPRRQVAPRDQRSGKDLAHRARNKRMKPEEFQGGNFTVSNLGRAWHRLFSAIINPPQGFILAVGAVRSRPSSTTATTSPSGQRMTITMSCDHRVIDGALGADYLKELRRLLENPTLLLI
jgi:pyruvate dehydrogenase E2 component (dihydrolipoamide acetyltransferase)